MLLTEMVALKRRCLNSVELYCGGTRCMAWRWRTPEHEWFRSELVFRVGEGDEQPMQEPSGEGWVRLADEPVHPGREGILRAVWRRPV